MYYSYPRPSDEGDMAYRPKEIEENYNCKGKFIRPTFYGLIFMLIPNISGNQSNGGVILFQAKYN